MAAPPSPREERSPEKVFWPVIRSLDVGLVLSASSEAWWGAELSGVWALLLLPDSAACLSLSLVCTLGCLPSSSPTSPRSPALCSS